MAFFYFFQEQFLFPFIFICEGGYPLSERMVFYEKIFAFLLCTVLLAASSLLPALAEDAPLLVAWAPCADTPTDIPREEASEMFHCANSAQNSAFRGLWIIWVAAGVIFPAVVAMTNAFEKKSKENFRQYRTNELVWRRMNFSSDAMADFEGLLEVNRKICKQQMAEKTSPTLPTNCAVLP